MKRSDIIITNKDIIKYCKREHAMQKKVYEKKLAGGQMKDYEANRYYLIILEYKELVEDLEQKGISWTQCRQMIKNINTRSLPTQGKLNFK